MTGKRSVRLLAFMTKEVMLLTRNGLMGRASNYEKTRRSFARFLIQNGRKDITVSKINSVVISDYEKWLLDSGMAGNSVGFYLRNLRSAIGKTARLGEVNRPKEGAFAKVSTAATGKRQRTVVDSDIIRDIQSMDVKEKVLAMGKDPNRRTTPNIIDRISLCRDLFIFSFCAQGMDFVDMCYLRKADISDGIIRYTRRMTKQLVEVAVLPQMQETMERYTTKTDYVFPLLTSNSIKEAHRQYMKALRDYNRGLQELSRMLPTPVSLSSLSARDAWASAAYQNGMSLPLICKALGFKDEASALKYLRSFETNGLGEANKTLIDSILG